MTHEDTFDYDAIMGLLLVAPDPGEALEVLIKQEREYAAHVPESLLREWYAWWEEHGPAKMPDALHIRTALVLDKDAKDEQVNAEEAGERVGRAITSVLDLLPTGLQEKIAEATGPTLDRVVEKLLAIRKDERG